MSVALLDGVTLTVEAAFSAATGTYGVWDSGLWDTATWGPDLTWSDITQWVRSFSTQRRFSRDIAAWDPGGATILLDNRDGRFSPDNLSGAYVSGGVTGIRPWRPVRIRATYSGTTYYLYQGYTQSFAETRRPGPGTGTGDATVTLTCLDEMARLARVDGSVVTPAGAGELSGSRIHRVLNAAGHTGPRAVDVGTVTMQATDLSRNTREELQLTTDSEQGSLWVEADSTVYFERQDALMENTRSNTVQATFGDGGAELPYNSPVFAYDGQLLRNIVSFTRVGGTAQVAADNSSRALYGDQRETRSDLLCETDVQALTLATFYLNQYKDPERRITSITVKPRRAPTTLYPQILGRKVRDLVRVISRPPGGFTLTRDCHIAGISHSMPSKGEWTTTFDLWSATFFETFASSRWDVGLWDSAAWFF